VFLCDKAYFSKFISTCTQLVTVGKYTGPICLVIGDDLQNDPLLQHTCIQENRIIIKHFPNIVFSNHFLQLQYSLNRPPHWFQKLFQYHKLHLFDVFFKQWDYLFYLDCGITIFSDITPMLNIRKENTLLAHSDAYPTYQWKLDHQFDRWNPLFPKLQHTYPLTGDYCQTTILLYDTSIIQQDTYTRLLQLMLEYPISITNDQGILALYFTIIQPCFEQIPIKNADTYFYDYLSRDPNNKYIMLKCG